MQTMSLIDKKTVMFEILCEIDSFCREHSIRYYLTGGTLLGAVRHKGFIPWDDDIDICLLRDDYERFINEFVSSSGNIMVLNNKNCEKYIWPFAKAVDKRTFLVENGFRCEKMGVYVDVFPMDNLFDDFVQSKRYVSKVNRVKNLLTLKHLKLNKNRSLLKNMAIILGKILFLIPDKVLINAINRKCTKYKNNTNSTYVCNLCGAWGIREIAKRSFFSDFAEVSFEGKKFLAPASYDSYLSCVYGDYMQLPPKDKQVSHHSSIEYWR